MLQSVNVANAVYEMDWLYFSSSTKKILLTIMMRSLQPIQFTSARVIVLSVDTFNSVSVKILLYMSCRINSHKIELKIKT